MNLVQSAIQYFLNLPRRRQIIYVSAFVGSIVLISVVARWRNPNGWQKVSELGGVTVPLRYDLHGIDVSHHNDRINWSKVNNMRFADDKKVEFVFVKATEGVSHVDEDFARNWSELKKNNLRRGAYHFYIPWKDPAEQANSFVKNVKLEEGDFAPVLDIERNSLKPDNQIIREIGVWLQLVEGHYGIKPIIYTNANFYKKFVKGHYDKYPLWIADYSKDDLEGYNKRPYIWQHTEKAWIEGIKGPVDLNVFLRKKAEIRRLQL
jgi:lysozyme